MKLLMISGDRSILQGKKGAFWYTLEEMLKHWERIDVICPRPGGMENGKWKMENEHPFENVWLHSSSRGLISQSRWIVEKGKELIGTYHHNVITAQEYPPFYNGIGACHLHKATGVPYALEVHHIVGWPHAASFTEWMGRKLSRWQIPKSAHHAGGVRVVNQEVKDILTRWNVPAEKIHVVSSFYLDAEKLRPDPSVQKKYDVVFCARLVPNKGLEDVLRAVAGLQNVTLLIAGDGPERKKMEFLARSLQITDRVHFAGWLPEQNAVIAAIQSARVFVMHSKSEGGPRIALEAMACGMPVISTKVGVMPEVIEDGISGVCTDGTVQDLQRNVQKLLGDESLMTSIGREAQKITQKFERRRLVKEYAEFLKSIVNRVVSP